MPTGRRGGSAPPKTALAWQTGVSERSLPGSLLAGRRQAGGSCGEVRHTFCPTGRRLLRVLGWACVTMMMSIYELEDPERFSVGIGRDTVMLRHRTSTLQTFWRFGFIWDHGPRLF